jgi:hypothetical protein
MRYIHDKTEREYLIGNPEEYATKLEVNRFVRDHCEKWNPYEYQNFAAVHGAYCNEDSVPCFTCVFNPYHPGGTIQGWVWEY